MPANDHRAAAGHRGKEHRASDDSEAENELAGATPTRADDCRDDVEVRLAEAKRQHLLVDLVGLVGDGLG